MELCGAESTMAHGRKDLNTEGRLWGPSSDEMGRLHGFIYYNGGMRVFSILNIINNLWKK